MNYPATPALLNLISPMSGAGSGLGRSVHIRAVSQNIRHRWRYSFLYGNSETHLLLGGTEGRLSPDFLFWEELSSIDVYLAPSAEPQRSAQWLIE